jgi:hypothetical protein
MHHDLAYWIDQYPQQGWLPVAGDGCGNLYVLVARGYLVGSVGFIETMVDPDRIDYLVASDLWRFLRFLFLRETGDRRWPFDRTTVLAADPNLLLASSTVDSKTRPSFVVARFVGGSG